MTPKALAQSVLQALGWARGGYRGLRGVGQRWEAVAEKRLRKAGYRILERNYRVRGGEIDFVAQDGEILCFIEVKGRSTRAFGSPAEAVTDEKQRRIWNAAEVYLRRKRLRPTCRFDVVAIEDDGAAARVELLRGAFEGPPAPFRPR